MINLKTHSWHHSVKSIWIFIEGEGDGIESRLPFKILSTLPILQHIWLFQKLSGKIQTLHYKLSAQHVKSIIWGFKNIVKFIHSFGSKLALPTILLSETIFDNLIASNFYVHLMTLSIFNAVCNSKSLKSPPSKLTQFSQPFLLA